ncbi:MULTISPECIES: hypothetical protein [unclassified Mesorhizobium]|uniref:hypothetical protein n=1 Tax=unclassified Mesorhizobium TaxID=325217 RepID=UPI0011295DC2|nr:MULTISPECIES: hypothetical protein [unclassified Mesorhizobium]MBZ9700545.1 hypothetical protein [Mesorhizobium sp. CO1-1-3]MBZ9946481.1 hypothetical protein [Mesorhizobium sp. BR1-1-11]TPI96528.1 hypothetical protein FJ428_27430 [Mesorhizobium sp. B2-8-1]
MKAPKRDDVRTPAATDAQKGGLSRLSGTRRDVLVIIGVSGVAFFTVDCGEGFAQEAEAGGDTPVSGAGGDERRLTFDDDVRRPYNDKEKIDQQEEPTNIEAILGSAYRAPMCGFQSMTANQLIATRTADRPPGRVDVGPGAFFSDGHNQKMTASGETALGDLVRQAAAKLPEGVIVSVGGEFEPKDNPGMMRRDIAPGRAPVFVLFMKEYSRGHEGGSITIGIGKKAGGYISVSGNDGSQSWSAGVFASVPGTKEHVTLMEGVNLTDLVNGTITFEVGGIVSGHGVVEVISEVRPVEIAHDIFVNVLGPLSDHKNFQDPMISF